MPPTFETTLRMTEIAVAIWCTLSSLEWLAASPSYRPTRALGRDIARLRSGRLGRMPWSWLFSQTTLFILILSRLAAGLGLLVAAESPPAVVLLAVIALATGLLSFATEAGDGADKIGIIACSAAGLLLVGILSHDHLLCLTGVAWGAGQLSIAYMTSGVAKLSRPFWRDGTAIAAALTSHRAGHPLSAAFVRHPVRARCLAWAIMLPETLFPVALLAPPSLCAVLLFGFALFHFSTAVVMGLSTYPWGFMATYPCLLMANRAITEALGLWHGWRA